MNYWRLVINLLLLGSDSSTVVGHASHDTLVVGLNPAVYWTFVSSLSLSTSISELCVLEKIPQEGSSLLTVP